MALLLVCTWGPRLVRGFWVDEAGTFWMSHEGPLAAIHKTLAWPGQSILYSVIASLFTLSGGPLREIVLRIPTLAAMVAASYFVYRLAERLVGHGAGFVAVALFLFNPLTIEMGTEARPYGLALAAVAGSFWALSEWLRDRRDGQLAQYVIFSTLIVYLHYLFVPVLAVHAVVAAYVFLIRRRTQKAWRLAGAWIATIALTAPLWGHMRLLAREAHTLPFTPPPLWPDFIWLVLNPLLLFGLFLGGLVIWFWRGGRSELGRGSAGELSRTSLLLLGGWWILIPALFFGVSIATSARPLLPRYISFNAEALGILLAALGLRLFDATACRVWVLVAIALTTGNPGRILSIRHAGQEELRPIFQTIAAESTHGLPPVFFSSELPESTFYNWRAGVTPDSYLYAPFAAYPIKNKVLPLPYLLTPEVKEYMSSLIDGELRKQDEVIFVTHRSSWNDWVQSRMAQAGYHATVLTPNAFYVTIFKR